VFNKHDYGLNGAKVRRSSPRQQGLGSSSEPPLLLDSTFSPPPVTRSPADIVLLSFLAVAVGVSYGLVGCVRAV
jgi:hypothetical protein